MAGRDPRDYFNSRPGAADLKGFEQVEGVLPEADLRQTAAGQAARAGNVFAEPITPERMGVLKSALAQVNAPPPPKPQPIDRMMAAIAEGVRSPTYQNPPPNSRPSTPKPSTFADLEHEIGVAPSGQSTGAFNAVDMDQQLGRYLSSEYSGGGMREAAGIRGQAPMARSGVVQGAVQDFTQANPNLRSAFNNFRPDMSGGWEAAASDEALAQHLFNNSQGYLSGGPRQGLPAVVRSSRGGNGFTMNGPASEVTPPSGPMKALPRPATPLQLESSPAFTNRTLRTMPLGQGPGAMADASRVPLAVDRGAGASPIPSAAPRGAVTIMDDPAAMVEASRTPLMADRGGRMVEGFGRLGPEMPVTRDYSHLGMGGGGSGPTISDLHDEYVRGTIRPPRTDRVASGMGGPGAAATDEVAAGMGRAGLAAERGTIRMPRSATPTFMEDLGTLGSALKSGAGKAADLAMAPLNYVGGKIVANPVGAAGARVAGTALRTVAPYVAPAAAVLEATNKEAQPDSVEQALGLGTMNQRFQHMLDAEKRGEYGTVASDMAKNAGHAVYSTLMKPGVMLGDYLMGPSMTPEQQKAASDAKVAKLVSGPSLANDTDMSDPYKNAARAQQLTAQRERRLQNEPTVTIRDANGQEQRLLADEMRASPLRAEIMKNGFMSGAPSSTVAGERGVASAPAGGAYVNGAAGNDVVDRMRSYGRLASEMIRQGVPPGIVNSMIGDAPNYENIDAGRELRSAQAQYWRGDRPLKESDKIQGRMGNFLEEYADTEAALQSPRAKSDAEFSARAAARRDYLLKVIREYERGIGKAGSLGVDYSNLRVGTPEVP